MNNERKQMEKEHSIERKDGSVLNGSVKDEVFLEQVSDGVEISMRMGITKSAYAEEADDRDVDVITEVREPNNVKSQRRGRESDETLIETVEKVGVQRRAYESNGTGTAV